MISLHYQEYKRNVIQYKVNFHGVLKWCPSSFFLEWYLILHGACFHRHTSSFLVPFSLGTPELIERARSYEHDAETYPNLRIKYKIPFFIAPHPSVFGYQGSYFHTIEKGNGKDMLLQTKYTDFYSNPEEYFAEASQKLYGVHVEQINSMDAVHSLIYF